MSVGVCVQRCNIIFLDLMNCGEYATRKNPEVPIALSVECTTSFPWLVARNGRELERNFGH